MVDEEEEDVVTATCWHGTTITAAVQKDNIFATQFHPEKSQENGLKVLTAFVHAGESDVKNTDYSNIAVERRPLY